jgi:hypothetical protein
MPYLPDPKSFIYDICRVNPRQLAPTVGILGVGIMNSMAFLLLASNSTEVGENQEMELTIRSLNILIGPSVSSRLSDPMKQDPSASEPKTTAMMEYSEGSSSKVNSPISPEEVQKERSQRTMKKRKILMQESNSKIS